MRTSRPSTYVDGALHFADETDEIAVIQIREACDRAHAILEAEWDCVAAIADSLEPGATDLMEKRHGA